MPAPSDGTLATPLAQALAGHSSAHSHWLNLTALGWMAGGKIAGKHHIDLPPVGSLPQLTIGPVRNVDRERWADDRPLSSMVIRRTTIVCELQRTASPEVAEKYGELRPREAFGEWSRLVGLDELTFAVGQCVDLIKLFAAPSAQNPFGEALMRYAGGGRNEQHHMTFYHPFRTGIIGRDWAITDELAAQLADLWRNLLAGGNAEQVRFPLRRWGMAVQRQWDEDRLIDLWIALEGLFKRDHEVRDIPAKISPRVRDLLGLPRKPVNRLQESYDVRIAVAHGRWTYGDREVLRAVDIVEELLRDALKVLIQQREHVDVFSHG